MSAFDPFRTLVPSAKHAAMYRDNGYSPPRRGLRSLGWAVLVLGLPLALLAALHPPNEYQATLGINALDCAGPGETYLFALPALAIYGAGLAVNGWRWRKRLNAVAAVLCLGICAAVVANVARAVHEGQRQAAACS
jgi:hypothetical protein